MEDTILAEEEKRKKSESDPVAVMSTMNNDEDELSKPKDFSNNKNEELELAKAEMGQVAEENKRLKSNLDRMMKDYQTLQMRFYQITQQGSKAPLVDVDIVRQSHDDTHELSLSLGRNSSIDSKNKDEANRNNFPESSPQQTLVKENSGLSLALDYKNQGGSKTSAEPPGTKQNSSTENSFDEPKDDATETWPPSKALKTMRSGGGRDDEVVQQPPVKKARVSVRARCDTPTMNDGCQWRKYGQKIAKGNPCPRAYYRCTVAPNCPVRKQVQRCADDMSILITTYEGTHNHPLPISATAMASTTSAAAYMLVSGSSTSNSGIGSSCNASNSNTTTTFPSNYVSNFPGLNFNPSETSRSRPFFLPNSSFLPSPSQPTITLDLTTSSSSSSSASQLSKLASTNYTPRPYPNSTNLTFNSLELSNTNPNSNILPFSWPPNGHQTYNKTQPPGIPSIRDQDGFYQTLLQKINPNPNPNPNVVSTPNCSNKPPPLDPVAAAAKAITSDPSFQSVLTAALSSLIGVNHNVGVSAGNQSSSTSSLLQATTDGGAKGNGCASSVIGIAPNNTANAQTRNLMLLSSPLPFSNSSKSTSSSPGASRDHHS